MSKKQPVSLENILGKPKDSTKLEQKYDVGKVLGKGAFGVVKLVTDKGSKQQFAVKSISKAKLRVQEDVDDVKREVQILNHVGGHQNIVQVKETFEDKGYVHIVMEVCAGGELFDAIVSAGSYTEKVAAQVFEKMVRMIQHCHDLGVMHRDLKPENFLLVKAGDVGNIKATDFGLSTFFKQGETFKELVGSPYYVAPEVLRRHYSYQSDYWSLGVILYILLCGLPPFWGDNDTAIFKMILQGQIDFDTQPWPRISPEAKDLIKKLLTVDPSKRISVHQVLEHPWMQGNCNDTQLDSVVVERMKQFAAMNKLKKTAMMMIGQKLSPEEIEGMKKLFKAIDTDNSGTISVSELQTALEQWGHSTSQKDLVEVMKMADVDGDGVIDYNEFVAATMNISKLEKDELIQKTFMEMDTDGSGTLSTKEIKEALAKFNLTEDVDAIIKAADSNKDGQIDYREFQAMMRETMGVEDEVRGSLRALNLGPL